jgi:hypothetical protein
MSKEKREPNYRALFVIGLSFLGAGVALSAAGLTSTGIALTAVGVVFFVIGISNRKKWISAYDYKQISDDEN